MSQLSWTTWAILPSKSCVHNKSSLLPSPLLLLYSVSSLHPCCLSCVLTVSLLSSCVLVVFPMSSLSSPCPRCLLGVPVVLPALLLLLQSLCPLADPLGITQAWTHLHWWHLLPSVFLSSLHPKLFTSLGLGLAYCPSIMTCQWKESEIVRCTAPLSIQKQRYNVPVLSLTVILANCKAKVKWGM